MEDTHAEKNPAPEHNAHFASPGIFEVGHSPNEIVPAADGPEPIEGRLRKAPLRVPDNYEECSGFTLFGRRIRTLLYSTDVAAIRNSNADAIFAVYPFTAQPAITQALLTVAEAPLFVGVGGGTTTGRRAAELAAVSEMQGAAGVVLNSPATPEMVAQVSSTVDIPVIATITRFDNEAAEKIQIPAEIEKRNQAGRTAIWEKGYSLSCLTARESAMSRTRTGSATQAAIRSAPAYGAEGSACLTWSGWDFIRLRAHRSRSRAYRCLGAADGCVSSPRGRTRRWDTGRSAA